MTARAARATPAPKRLTGQFLWVISGRIGGALLQAASLVLAARSMAIEEFGHLATFLGVVVLVQASVDLGVATLIARQRAADPESPIIPAALRFTSWSSVVMVVILASGLLAVGLWASDVYLFMTPLAVWAAAERNADSRLTVAFADGDARINVVNLISRRTVAVLLFLGLADLGVEPLLSFSLAAAVAAVGSALFAQRYIRNRVRRGPSEVGTRELLRLARPYWINGLATQARNLDVVVVGALAGAAQAGLYSSGSRLTSPLRILPTSLASVLLPATARSGTSRRALQRFLRIMAIMVAAMTVVYGVLFALVGQLVAVILGDEYSGSTVVIRLILLGLPFAAAASMMNSVLQGRGRGREVATASTMTTVGCLAGMALVAPWWGAQGAAAVLAVSFVLQVGLLTALVTGEWRRAEKQ